MIVFSWNTRGLSARIKRSSVRKLITQHQPHLVFLQETKIECITNNTLKTIWNVDDIQWLFSPSVGNSGGLLSIWKSNFFKMETSNISRFWIGLTGYISSQNMMCTFINLYNPCTAEGRAAVWLEIADFCTSNSHPCFIIGDYNETLEPNDRGSQFISCQGTSDFQNFIHNLGLVEISATNGMFTWFRGQSKSKLDRLFVQPEWLTSFPALKLSLLKRSISDHCPLLAYSSIQNWGPKPFRFLNCWLSHPRCMKIISEVWSKNQDISFPDKLRALKEDLKQWNHSEFGIIDENIRNCEDKIHFF